MYKEYLEGLGKGTLYYEYRDGIVWLVKSDNPINSKISVKINEVHNEYISLEILEGDDDLSYYIIPLSRLFVAIGKETKS